MKSEIEYPKLYERAKALLRRFYGYADFRPGQWPVIEALCQSRDALVLMPTGGGKSMCYQMPALLAEGGCCVVVSPLIALMDDQVQSLLANGIPAAAVHSNNSESYNREVMDGVLSGKIRLLYISPERLLVDIERWNKDMPVKLFAIDEAHCISQWGHDFRPVYTSLSVLKDRWPDVPMVALTATADKLTREDISTRLKLRDPLMSTGSFDRPNLRLRAFANPGSRKRLGYIESMVRKYPNDSGIVYCLSRKTAETLDAQLRQRGIRSCCYHAKLTAEQRREAHRAFLEGAVQVVCATVAFGMGIDKSNIRWVIHNNLPQNIESFYQEIGRAGRDGLPAEATLFHSFGDIVTLRKFVEESGRVAINSEKLKRMDAYANARVCRRRILLSYFGEEASRDCGNCDICLNPPARFDGTILAQKAISAVLRTESRVGVYTLVDILRGSSRLDIRREGFDRIKTFGAGSDLSREEWLDYIGQMIQLGVFEVAYDKGNVLRVTSLGMRIVRGEEPFELAQYVTDGKTEKKTDKIDETIKTFDAALFEKLKSVRAQIAREERRAAYVIFSDVTLRDMARRKPATVWEFGQVHGVGEYKCAKYASRFLSVINPEA